MEKIYTTMELAERWDQSPSKFDRLTKHLRLPEHGAFQRLRIDGVWHEQWLWNTAGCAAVEQFVANRFS